MENKMVVRDSNMELYRIVAMLLVMLFHVFGEVDQMGNQLFPDSLEPYHVINLLLTSSRCSSIQYLSTSSCCSAVRVFSFHGISLSMYSYSTNIGLYLSI